MRGLTLDYFESLCERATSSLASLPAIPSTYDPDNEAVCATLDRLPMGATLDGLPMSSRDLPMSGKAPMSSRSGEAVATLDGLPIPMSGMMSSTSGEAVATLDGLPIPMSGMMSSTSGEAVATLDGLPMSGLPMSEAVALDGLPMALGDLPMSGKALPLRSTSDGKGLLALGDLPLSGKALPVNSGGEAIATLDGIPMSATLDELPMRATLDGLPMSATLDGLPMHALMSASNTGGDFDVLPLPPHCKGIPARVREMEEEQEDKSKTKKQDKSKTKAKKQDKSKTKAKKQDKSKKKPKKQDKSKTKKEEKPKKQTKVGKPPTSTEHKPGLLETNLLFCVSRYLSCVVLESSGHFIYELPSPCRWQRRMASKQRRRTRLSSSWSPITFIAEPTTRKRPSLARRNWLGQRVNWPCKSGGKARPRGVLPSTPATSTCRSKEQTQTNRSREKREKARELQRERERYM